MVWATHSRQNNIHYIAQVLATSVLGLAAIRLEVGLDRELWQMLAAVGLDREPIIMSALRGVAMYGRLALWP